MLVRTRQHATSIFDLAEDLAQEALVQAVTGLPKIREPEAFLAWLKVIVDRVIATHHGQARPGAPDHSVDLEVLPDAGTTDQAALNSVDVEMVRRAVAALPPKSRLMVELVYFEGMTCAEVAEFLRVSREAVKSTLHRSRKRLRRSVRAVSITETEQATLCASMVSGEHTPGGPLFGHDSDIARFYVALYPRGLPDRAAEEAEVTSQRANELMAFLEDRRLVARENGVVRCTMPVVSDVDLQVLHPWATEAADVFHRELDSIVEQATAIAHTVGHLIAPGSEPRSTGQNHPVVEQLRDSSCSRSAEQTVLAAALHEARVLALHRFENAMRVSAPDRGAHGKWTAAVTTAEAFPQGQHGHMSSAHQ